MCYCSSASNEEFREVSGRSRPRLAKLTSIALKNQAPGHSAVRSHADRCGTYVSEDQFVVVDSETSKVKLRILESLYIFKNRPDLNETKSAFPLLVVKS